MELLSHDQSTAPVSLLLTITPATMDRSCALPPPMSQIALETVIYFLILVTRFDGESIFKSRAESREGAGGAVGSNAP